MVIELTLQPIEVLSSTEEFLKAQSAVIYPLEL